MYIHASREHHADTGKLIQNNAHGVDERLKLDYLFGAARGYLGIIPRVLG
jgi:hypothetical protein